LGEPRMYESIALSADGRHVLARWVERPFSFITSWRGFPGRTAVLDRSGAVVATLERRGLREGAGGGDGAGPGGGRGAGAGLRALAWHPAGAGLTYIRRVGGRTGAGGAGGAGVDEVMLLAAPFDTARAQVV